MLSRKARTVDRGGGALRASSSPRRRNRVRLFDPRSGRKGLVRAIAIEEREMGLSDPRTTVQSIGTTGSDEGFPAAGTA